MLGIYFEEESECKNEPLRPDLTALNFGKNDEVYQAQMIARHVLHFIFYGLTLGLSMVCCQTQQAEKIIEKPHWIYATGQLAPTSSNADVLKFEPTASLLDEIADDEIYARGGLVWQSFLTAQKPFVKLMERDFLLALRSGNKKFEVFRKDTCFVTTKSNQKSKKVVLKANLKTPARAEGNLFYIYDADSRDFVGVGSFDGAGQARCELPQNSPLTVSTGFGEGRRETVVATGNLQQTIDVTPEHAQVQIRGGELDIREGDIVRIARVRVNKTTDGDKVDDMWRHISQRIDDDFFRMVVSPTENFGASEMMSTTVGVSDNTLSLPLEPGTYIATAIERRSGRVCTQSFTVKDGEVAKIGCRYKQSSQKGLGVLSTGTRRTLRTDATKLPESFMNQSGLRNWLTQHGFDFLYVDVPNQPNPDVPKKYLMPMLESTLQKFDLKTSKLEVSNEVIHSNLDGNLERYLSPSLHLAETGARHFLDGEVTPFLTTSQWFLDPPFAFQPDKNAQLLTNGAQIELTEPLVTNRHLVEMLATPRVRGRLLVPPFQKTEFLEIYINRTLSKRIVLPRNLQGALDSEYEFFFDERLDEKEDFYITVIAWGENFLPEVVYGSGRVKPFAILMPMCFDINKNKVCDAKL